MHTFVILRVDSWTVACVVRISHDVFPLSSNLVPVDSSMKTQKLIIEIDFHARDSRACFRNAKRSLPIAHRSFEQGRVLANIISSHAQNPLVDVIRENGSANLVSHRK